MNQVLRKAFKLDLKALDDSGTFEGYAAVFGNVDAYGDVIEKGAFKRTLDHWKSSGKPIPILWQHDPGEPIGATIEASEDDHGLRVKGQLVLDTARAREAHALLKAGVLGGLSIGYTTVKDEWDRENDTRILKEVRLWEYSLVTWPANEQAIVTGVKQLADEMAELRRTLDEFKGALRGVADPATGHSAGGGLGSEYQELAALLDEIKQAAKPN